MARPGIPYTFRPSGYTDSIDGTNAPQGSMTQLANLIPASSTASIFVPRAAASNFYSFSDFTTPQQVTALLTIGTRVYGMVASADFPGHDVPFCYDFATSSDVPISGTTSANTPLTQTSSGDWQPPKLCAITATKIIVTHVGFDGVTHFFGVIDISTPATPAWSSGTTTGGVVIATVPNSVGAFNGRAWYAVKNTLVFSDALNPTVVTNASQVLTLGDNTNVTALAGLPLSSATQGGIIGSLIAFKGDAVMYQITGDQTTSNLLLNQLNVATGTTAPNTICSTPLGLAFVAPDGLRIIDFTARVSDPLGANGQGANVPFLSALNPSRMSAAFNQNVLRVSCQNGAAGNTPWQEYWLDFNLKIWTGPHQFANTTAPSLLQPYQGASGLLAGHGFVFAVVGVNATLWLGRVNQTTNDTYVENGVQLQWAYQPTLFPDNSQTSENKIVDTTFSIALPQGLNISVQATDAQGNILDTVFMTGTGSAPSQWGSMIWGSGSWGSVSGYFRQYRVAWHRPLVFKQLSLLVSGVSQLNFAIGNFYIKYQPLGYLLQETGS